MTIIDDMKPCLACGERVATDWKFCISCGKENSDFDPKEFEKQQEETLEAFQNRECLKGHPVEQRAAQTMQPGDLEALSEAPFCSACGMKIEWLKK